MSARLVAPNQQAQADEGQRRVHQQQLVTELVPAQPPFRVELEHEADQGSRQGDKGYILVFHLFPCQDAEGEKPEERSVCITGELVDRIDGAGTVEGVEDDDDDPHQDGHPDVHAFSDARVAVLAEDVYREGGRQGSEGGSARPIGAGNQAEDEQDAGQGRQSSAGGDCGEQPVSGFGDPVRGGILVQERSQTQEESDDDGLKQAAQDQVLLGIPRVFAGEGSLHHVLVQAGHGNDSEQPAQELLPEILRMVDVIEEEDFFPDLDAAEIPPDQDDAQGDGQDHAGRLEDVGPDDGADAAPVSVDQADADIAENVDPERQAERAENQQLQGQADEEEPHRGPEHLRDEEEPGAGPVGPEPETLLQVLVDGYDIQPEIQRREDEGDDQVTQEKPDTHLQVAESAGPYHAGHRNERDPRHAGTDHGKGDYAPVRPAPSGEEGTLAAAPAGSPGYQEHGRKIGQDGEEDGARGHAT